MTSQTLVREQQPEIDHESQAHCYRETHFRKNFLMALKKYKFDFVFVLFFRTGKERRREHSGEL
jgi:hypothetical protein